MKKQTKKFNSTKFDIELTKLCLKHNIKKSILFAHIDKKTMVCCNISKSIKTETKLAHTFLNLLQQIDLLNLKNVEVLHFLIEKIITIQESKEISSEETAYNKLSNKGKIKVDDLRELKSLAVRMKDYELGTKYREQELEILNKKTNEK